MHQPSAGGHSFILRTLLVLSLGVGWVGCAKQPAPPQGNCPELVESAVTGMVMANRLRTMPYLDPLEALSRMAGSTFVEIQEVRARDDGKVFFCSGVKGLNVVDAQDPALMIREWQLASNLGSIQFPRCQHLATSGDYVFVTSRGDEVQPVPFITAFDLSQSPPTEATGFTSPAGWSFEGVAVSGAQVFTAMHADGLAVFDFDGSSFQVRATVTEGLTNAWGVAIVASLVYVADASGRLVIVDVSNLDQPAVVGSVEVGGAAQSVEIDPVTQTAYVAAGAGGMVVVDVANPAAPVVRAQVNTPGSALQVAIANGHAYVADWRDIRVFDVTDPSNPQMVATETVQTDGDFSRVLGIGAMGDFAFAGEWTGLYSFQHFPGRTAPDIAIRRASVEFGNILPGCQERALLSIENEGTEPLEITGVSIIGDASFTVPNDGLTLAPAEASSLEVVFAPPSGRQLFADLLIESDDPDEPALEIPMTGNRAGVGPGDEAPEIAVVFIDGTEWALSEQRGSPVMLAYFATF